MREYRTTAEITPDHRVVLEIPEDIPPGKVDIVVTVPEEAPKKGDMRKFLQELANRPRETRSREEIDRELQAERDSWD
jgi:hypothetical protein